MPSVTLGAYRRAEFQATHQGAVRVGPPPYAAPSEAGRSISGFTDGGNACMNASPRMKPADPWRLSPEHWRGLIEAIRQHATSTVTPDDSRVDELYAGLVAAYSQPHRHYHTIRHLAECLSVFDTVRQHAVHPHEVELALWFHDAIYSTRATDNEARSARAAGDAATLLNLPEDAVARIVDLVLATEHRTVPSTADAGLLVDVDLSILGADPRRFREYEADVRREYAHVPEATFKAKRSEILESLLARERIFVTDALRQLEEPARANLASSLQRLAGNVSQNKP